MRKLSLIVLITCLILTVLLFGGWVLGFAFAAPYVGSLIHLLLVMAMLTSFGAFIGLILLIVSLFQKK